ncbi:MAG TPA: hypothetical protein VFO38_06270, partial [Candidatus Saccharimonadales bacterium]|nr:hypothetical protein [Candidatus Saccharimonadales bacterium]
LNDLEAKVLKTSEVQKVLAKICARLAPKSSNPDFLAKNLESCVRGLVSALSCVVLLPRPAQPNPELPSEVEIAAAVAKLPVHGKQSGPQQVEIFRSVGVSDMLNEHGKFLAVTVNSPELKPALEELAAAVTNAVYSILKIKNRPVKVVGVDIPLN